MFSLLIVLRWWFWCCLIWAMTWQNQQNKCAPSEDSHQPGHPSSLIRVFAVCMNKPWALSYPLSAQRRLWSDWADAQADLKTLIRLGGCPGWSEPSLGTHSFFWFCHVAAHFCIFLRWAFSLLSYGFVTKFLCFVLSSIVITLLIEVKEGGWLLSWLSLCVSVFEPLHEKTCLMPYANKKDAKQPAHPQVLVFANPQRQVFETGSFEPRHEKTCIRGLRPGKTQTSLLSYRSKLEFWNFGYSK